MASFGLLQTEHKFDTACEQQAVQEPHCLSAGRDGDGDGADGVG